MSVCNGYDGTEPLRVSIPEERPSVRAQLQQIQKKRREMRLISPEEKLAREIFSLTLRYNPSKVIPPEKRQQVIKAFTRDIKKGNIGYMADFLETVQETSNSASIIEQAAQLLSKLTEFIVHQREEQEWGGMEL